jgi:hypothetical protein
MLVYGTVSVVQCAKNCNLRGENLGFGLAKNGGKGLGGIS